MEAWSDVISIWRAVVELEKETNWLRTRSSEIDDDWHSAKGKVLKKNSQEQGWPDKTEKKDDKTSN